MRAPPIQEIQSRVQATLAYQKQIEINKPSKLSYREQYGKFKVSCSLGHQDKLKLASHDKGFSNKANQARENLGLDVDVFGNSKPRPIYVQERTIKKEQNRTKSNQSW